jgi:3-oxoacyl-[acyl-carrier protein] reductase
MTEIAQLDGRVAVVTGGSRGIGRAIAAALLARGARVAIAGRNPAALKEASTTLGAGDRLLALTTDVASEPDAIQLIRKTVERFGGLDILVNNAGVGRFGPVADMTTNDWHTVLGTNLTGVFFCSRAALPHLKRRGGGWIINISSLASTSPSAGRAAYSASKAALNAFTEALMLETRHDNIRVSMVLPGSVGTEFGGGGEGAGADWKLTAEDVAQVVVDLIEHPARSLPSRVELRPSKPPKKG